jgi:hypothetical protein
VVSDKLNLPSFPASVLNFLSWRDQTHAFERLAAVGFSDYTLTCTGEPEQLSGRPQTSAVAYPEPVNLINVEPVSGRCE